MGERGLARGPFLASVALAALSACAGGRRPDGGASPEPPDELKAFMAASAVLTGFTDLDAADGAHYYQAIRSDATRYAALRDVLQRGGFDTPGAFNRPQARAIAAQIVEYWYSGIAPGPDGPQTVTWLRALAWRSCTFTKAPSLCTAPGSWARRPGS